MRRAGAVASILLAGCIVAGGVLRGRRRRRRSDRIRTEAVNEFRRAYESDSACSVAIVIPAFNETSSIAEVLRQIPSEIEGREIQTIVVIDGADDDTEQVALSTGALVAVHATNLGQGAALRTGFSIAVERDAEVIVTMDADGQHDPTELAALVKPVIARDADYVQGSRFLGRYDDEGSLRSVGARAFTQVLNRLGGLDITDCANGFRAIDGKALRRLDLREDRFSAAEILLESARSQLRIREVPVHYKRRINGQSKKPRRLGYPLGFLRVMVAVRFRRPAGQRIPAPRGAAQPFG